MAGEIRIRVTPQVLKEKAGEVERNIAAVSDGFDKMNQVMKKTAWYWLGAAGDTHRKKYEEQNNKVVEEIVALKDFPQMLLRMAGVYEEAERENVEQSAGLHMGIMDGELPGDILS